MTDRSPRWKTLDSELTYEGERFEAYRDDVRLPGGEETTFEYVHEPSASVVLPFTADGEVLTVREWRQSVKRTVTGLPGGGLDGETPKVAAERELLEETGYVPSQMDYLVTVETTNGLTDGVHHHFVAYDCTSVHDTELGKRESLSVEPRPFDDLYNDVLSGAIRDSKTVVAVLRYAAQRNE